MSRIAAVGIEPFAYLGMGWDRIGGVREHVEKKNQEKKIVLKEKERERESCASFCFCKVPEPVEVLDGLGTGVLGKRGVRGAGLQGLGNLVSGAAPKDHKVKKGIRTKPIGKRWISK